MTDRKCWIAGHEATGNLLYYAPTRGKAREQMAGDFGINFYDSLWARVRRVPELDDLSHLVLDDHMAFLYAGMFDQCRTCGTEVSFDDDYKDPWWMSQFMNEYFGPVCLDCANDRESGSWKAKYLSREDILAILQRDYQIPEEG